MIKKNGWIQNMLMKGLSKVSNQTNGWAQEQDKMKKKIQIYFLLTCIELVSYNLTITMLGVFVLLKKWDIKKVLAD